MPGTTFLYGSVVSLVCGVLPLTVCLPFMFVWKLSDCQYFTVKSSALIAFVLLYSVVLTIEYLIAEMV